MSKAVKCDICGSCFDRFDKTGEHIHIQDLFLFDCSQPKPKKNEGTKYKNYYEDFDLCPRCTERVKTCFGINKE